MSTYRPDAMAYLTGKLSGNPHPSSISNRNGGGKFDHQGKALHWPGNTFVCHVNPQSREHDALVDVQRALQTGSHANAFTFLPSASFHMTVFQGVSANSKDWPVDVPTTVDRDAVSQILLKRLQTVELPDSHRIRPVDIFAGHSITVSGSDAEQEQLLRRTREQLREATRIQQENFETYTFHITLAYLVRWLSDNEAEEVIELSGVLTDQLCASTPEILLGGSEFCEFEDMNHFEPVHQRSS